ncbi:hypothetical protein [Stenotrophomonas sp. TD3]|uniref:hypothetical protein n=1 Tax=Stenotrophomonas sp. TD3 TaxID=1641707 RepID=UPI00147D05A5|nr:hypothetical protein [Stenotrophomonas sp. TD3]
MLEQDIILALAGPAALDRAALPCSTRLPLPFPFVSQQPARSARQVPHRLP